MKNKISRKERKKIKKLAEQVADNLIEAIDNAIGRQNKNIELLHDVGITYGRNKN